MRHFLPIFFLFLLASCLDESSVPPAEPTTFVRYYNGGFNDAAVAIAETPDKGFIILSTLSFKANSDTLSYKIKLIKTDAFGNPVWDTPKIFPPVFKSDGTGAVARQDISYKAASLQILPNGGYVITGEEIQKDLTAKILLMRVDANGENPTITSLPASAAGVSSTSVSGQALGLNEDGDFLVLSTSGSTDMVLGKMKKDFTSANTTFTWKTGAIEGFVNKYDAGTTSLANRLFIDDAHKVFWAGTATKFGTTGVRIVKTAQNSQNVDFDLMLLNPGYIEEATDFCRFGFGYAIIGSTNMKTLGAPPGDKDILFKRLSETGIVLESKSFPLTNAANPNADTQNDVGNSISSTRDGGLIMLASVNSLALDNMGRDGRGDNDYLLIKINAFGVAEWDVNFGSRFRDTGVAVRQVSDGGYIVLGTTLQGSQEITMLAKLNSKGKLE